MLVRFHETAFTSTERVSARGVLHFRPIGDWTLPGDPDEHVNSRPFTRVVDSTGRVDQELANTGVERAWQVTYTGNPGWGPVYVQVLGAAGEPVDWLDLVRVDPATLEPTAEPEAAWWAAWTAMAAGTYLVPDPVYPGLYIMTEGSTLTPDPDYPGLYSIGSL